MGEAGFLGANQPEEYGGADMGFADLGVDRLVPIARGRSVDELIEFVSRTADSVVR